MQLPRARMLDPLADSAVRLLQMFQRPSRALHHARAASLVMVSRFWAGSMATSQV